MEFKHLSYGTSVIGIAPENFICPSAMLRTEFTSPVANPLARDIEHDFLCTL